VNNLIPSIRAKKLFSYFSQSIDAILIANSGYPFFDSNFRYLTDAQGGVFEGTFTVVTRKGTTIITSVLEEGIARKTGCRVIAYDSQKKMKSAIKASLKNRKIVGINEAGISVSTVKFLRKNLKGIKLRNIAKELSKSRIIKDDFEIDRLKKAARIASETARKIPEIIRIGMTEREAAAEIDFLLRSFGADAPAFETIAAFGSATSLPHYQSGNRKLKKGSTALFDFGALYKNYRSDITRTFLTKPIDRRIDKIYRVVLQANRAAISRIRPGIKAKDLDAAARKIISDAGYKKYFIHSTGHGLGVSEHDAGSISPRSKDILKENMVFTIEPGIYLPRIGGVRIEDDVIVTSKGSNVITNAPRELIIL